MRTTVLSVWVILVANSVNGQSYWPFSAEDSKRFVNTQDAQDSMYYFHPTESWEENDTLYFRQYGRLDELVSTLEFPECQPWGENIGYSLDPMWSGRIVKWHGLSNTLLIDNELGETLSFNFGLAVGDSAMFYSTGAIHYYLKGISEAEEDVLGWPEMVRSFSILAYDASETPVPTSFGDSPIRLGETYGLLRFIDAYHFPSTELVLTLAGQNTGLGYYQLTYDELFPWQVGDTLAYAGHRPGPQTGVFTSSYQVLVITDRVETADSVWIYFDEQVQVDPTPDDFPGNPFLMNYPNPIVYRKGMSALSLPVGGTDDAGNTLSEEEFDYCGTRRRYKLEGNWMNRCQECDCFIGYDGFGNSIEFVSYLDGVGILSRTSEPYGAPWGNSFVGLSYSSIAGEACGTFQPIGIDDKSLSEVSVYPNPANDYVRIESFGKLDAIAVYDACGRLVARERVIGYVHSLDLSRWPQGAYVVHGELNGVAATMIRLIKI